MKILYFGGQKSGKSKLAEQKALSLSISKPYYIATYNNSFDDKDMQQRIDTHQKNRGDTFITVQESFDLPTVIKENETYLVDCLSMWLLNNIDKDEQYFKNEIKKISQKDTNIVFVLNDVSKGVIPLEKLSRKYVDFTGLIGQEIVKICDEVYEVKFGIETKLK